MRPVISSEQMRVVDRLTAERYGVSAKVLMENAAQSVVDRIVAHLGSVKDRKILIFAGKGNNGGDGAAAARLLAESGASVTLCMLGKLEDAHGEARENFDAFEKLATQRDGQEFVEITSEAEAREFLKGDAAKYDCVVDAIFGSGFRGEVKGTAKVVLEALLRDEVRPELVAEGAFYIAVDIPTGLVADEAETDSKLTFHADETVSFTAPKLANVMPPASRANGSLIVADIGSPRELLDGLSETYLQDAEDAKRWLDETRFAADSYKNKRGHLVLVAGSREYSGAAVLAANSAMRSGVGLVTLAVPKSIFASVTARVLPEIMVHGVAETEFGSISADALSKINALLEKADALGIGCGLSQNGSTPELVRELIADRQMPVLADADALNVLAPLRDASSANENKPPLVLTPHEGEFLRLLGAGDKSVLSDRIKAVREFSEEDGVITVLKGERALIAERGGSVVINPTGNSGLGKAGNGDTLTGLIGGFLAQAAALKLDVFRTVCAAVYIGGVAGDIAAEKFGKRVMTASDVRECLTAAFERFEK